MSVINLEPRETGQLKIVFDDIEFPGGLLRVTFWRDLDIKYDDWIFHKPGTDLPISLGYTLESIDGVPTIVARVAITAKTIEVKMRDIFSSLPYYHKKKEKYFKQALVDGFDFSFYDTESVANILSVKNEVNPISFLPNPNGKFMRSLLRPSGWKSAPLSSLNTSEKLDVYCKLEVQEAQSNKYRLLTTGILQSSAEGSDKAIVRPRQSKPFLTPEEPATDSHRIWTIHFANAVAVGPSKVKVKPTTDPSDSTRYFMPFLGDNKTPALPWVTIPKVGRITQMADDILYPDTAPGVGTYGHAQWRRHIPAGLFFKNLFDYIYGKEKYSFTADASYVKLTAAKLIWDETRILGANPQPQIQVGRSGQVILSDLSNPENWLLLPQCLFGLYEDPTNIALQNGDNIVPFPKQDWSTVYESIWEVILELCYFLGLIPKVTIDRDTGFATIIFRARDKVEPNTYYIPAPIKSDTVVYPEAEFGVQIKRRDTFPNADTASKEFQDWYGFQADDNLPSIGVLKDPYPNPYTVPATAEKPATMETSLCFGADRCAFFGNPSIWWYSMGFPGAFGVNEAEAARRAENFPMFSPLIYSNFFGFLPKKGIIHGSLAGDLPFAFAPIVGGIIPGQNGGLGYNAKTVPEMMATLNGRFFIRTDEKIKLQLPSFTRFIDGTKDSPTYGKFSFEFCDIDYQVPYLGETWITWAFGFDFNSGRADLELVGLTPIDQQKRDQQYGTTVNPPDVPPVVTPPSDVEPLCGEHTITFGVDFEGTICDVSATIDGASVDATLVEQGDFVVAVDVKIDACLLTVGLHTICVTVTPCDTRIAPVTDCWDFIVNHRCCGTNIGGGTPGNPVGTTSTPFVMMGLAQSFTAKGSGDFLVSITGKILNSSTGGAQAKVQFDDTGVSSAPTNGDALIGSIAGALVVLTAGKTDDNFSAVTIIAGLTLGDTYWLDLALKVIGAGTASLQNLSIAIQEL